MTKPRHDRKPAKVPPRKGRFHHAASTARASVDRIAGKRGFAEADVLLNWPAIAGPALAASCQPVRVRYQRSRTLGATLIVRTSSARGPEIEHMAPVIVEKVNQFYGYRAVHRLLVTQSTGLGGAAPAGRGFAEDRAPYSGRLPSTEETPEPTDADRREAERLARDIRSPGLRTALARMGANVLAASRRSPTDS